MIMVAYCVGKYKICFLGCSVIMGAYCVGKVHNIIPR